jgi:hypothetical protein
MLKGRTKERRRIGIAWCFAIVIKKETQRIGLASQALSYTYTK